MDKFVQFLSMSGPVPDHVERIHQLDSWQTDRLFPCRLSPKCQGMWSSFEWDGLGYWVLCYFVWVSRLSSRPGVGL